MKVAYADPPYPGQSRRHYADHPDYAGEVDHADDLHDLYPGTGAVSRAWDAWRAQMSLLAGEAA